jgi:ABC-2 type transport system ATP-binding protein
MSAPLVIQTRQVSKQFDDKLAVDSVNLEVQPGEIYGLIGPNGAGKTTLIRLLATADEPTTGNIRIDGHTLLPGQPNPEIKRRIGYLPDDFPLYDDLTVWDYLDYFARLYYLRPPGLTERLDEVLALVKLDNKRHSLIGTLSRGMKQRLSLARTVIHRPRLLLLDEPVSGLDPMARIDYRETIKALQKQGITIFISSHILSDLEDFCTSIGIMEQGRLVESGQLQALYQKDYQQILISVLGDATPLLAHLQNCPQVQSISTQEDEAPNREQNREQIGIQFAGSDADAVELLRSLVGSGIPICEFYRSQETLEDIFLKLGYQKTA